MKKENVSAVHLIALAVDYDGTIAEGGVVSPSTRAALERFVASGRMLILVTGRILPELLSVFPNAELFHRIVAENGAVLYQPATKQRRLLGGPAPERLVRALGERGVRPLQVGDSIIATVRPHEVTALEVIRDLGLEHQVIFNREAVMLLQPGVNKATGLLAALKELRLSPHNVVTVGDSENDHALLPVGEVAVAVGNAVPTLKELADHVTTGHGGDGTSEAIDWILADEPSLIPARHAVLLGATADGRPVTMTPAHHNLLIAGSSGSGKSSLANGLLERMTERGYQVCVIDPEGDYEAFPGAVVFGSAQRGPTMPEIVSALDSPEAHIVVNLVGMPLNDRPEFFLRLLPRIQEWRARTGRPHGVVVDEAHHLLPRSWEPAPSVWTDHTVGMIFITVHPDVVSPLVLRTVNVAVVLGESPAHTLQSLAKGARPAFAALPPRLESGEAALWSVGSTERPTVFRVAPSETERRRHRRKYAEGELPPERSFYFRGPEGALNLRAQNLLLFRQLAAGVDDATWMHHLRQGDYSQWMEQAIKDPALARLVRLIEADASLSPAESRLRVARAIEERYTVPASA